MADTPLKLWEPEDPTSSYMWEFLQLINQKYEQDLKTYQDLHEWSINNLNEFWGEVWQYTGIVAKPFKQVLPSEASMFPRPRFFEGSTLNFAYNLLYPQANPDPRSPAIISVTESTTTEITWEQLRKQVQECAASMHVHGVQPHDRVAGYLGNHSNTVVAMLAATSLGAIWTSISADTGVNLVVEKLIQVKPVMLFADNGVSSHGKVHEGISKTKEIVGQLPTLKTIVVFETIDLKYNISDIQASNSEAWIGTYDDFLASATTKDSNHVEFEGFPPDHPAYILYSSGTTGKPKCIVHSAAGTLIQHKKEHVLQCNIRPGDRLFYVTTCSWMMWHWLVSGLASGATIVLYQGGAFKPHGDLSMPKLIERLKVTQFGTSAAFLATLEKNNCRPLESGLDLTTLRAIYSTGSPLAPSTFKYIYEAFPKTINLGSITGGTDIISLFGAPSPISPVYQGEIQIRGLGMAVCAVDPNDGKVLPDGEPGDLVCVKPFPCQPVGFWAADEDDAKDIDQYIGHKEIVVKYNKSKYRSSYFEKVEGAWHHGDFVRFNPNTGGMIMLGRSDGVLNPKGVRFGSSEIYNVLLKHMAHAVEDALCIGRQRKDDMNETVVLFVKMKPGVRFSQETKDEINHAIQKDLTASHKPSIIDECFEIPKTSNDKKVEVVIKHILSGNNVKVSASVANPECLEWYREWAKTH